MPLKIIRNRKGMSLIEVLVAAGLMAIVAMGMTGVITSMNKEQNNQTRIATLRELKSRFQFLISDQNSWNMILQKNAGIAPPNDNPLADCIVQKLDCAGKAVHDVTIWDASGATPFFTPPNFAANPPGAGSNGFNDKGVFCTSYDGTLNAGNDQCPISYKVVWEPICPISGACLNPLIRITVRLMYNPSSGAQVTSFSLGNSTAGGTGPTSWTNDLVAANTGKYDVVIKRSATSVNKAFAITLFRQGNPGIGGPGGGICTATGSGWTTRGDISLTDAAVMGPPGTQNPRWTYNAPDDPYGLVSVGNDGGITMAAGTYSCRMTAVAWAVDSFSIRLVRPPLATAAAESGSVGSSNASLTGYVQTTATSSPVISITAPTTFYFQQQCQQPYDGVSTLLTDKRYNMGLPSSPYSQKSIMATFSCTQTN